MSKSNPLERAFFLLDIIASANREMTLMEVVNASGLPQSSAFRLVSNLVDSGMLAFDQRTKTYCAGSRAHRLALMLSGERKLEYIVKPTLEALAQITKETAFFVLRSIGGNRLLGYVVPDMGSRTSIHPGFIFPAHASAAGKVIGAFSRPPLTGKQSDPVLEKFQLKTITDIDELAELYREIRANGFAVNDGELDLDVYSVCAPVFHHEQIAGAIGFVGPRGRILEYGETDVQEMIKVLTFEALQLSRLLKVK